MIAFIKIGSKCLLNKVKNIYYMLINYIRNNNNIIIKKQFKMKVITLGTLYFCNFYN